MVSSARMPDFTPDLPAYFARIGYTGSRDPTLATLRAVQFLHVQAIPFENLDVLLGKTISLEPAAIEQKLVRDRRGGYCYEQNAFFARVLRALGFHVSTLIARVRWQRPVEDETPRTHMILRVKADGRPWIADVGFGSIGISAPLALDVGDTEQPSPHEPRRIVQRGDHLVHQVRLGDEWADVFQFTPDEVPSIDYEVANWWSNKYPRSHFQQNLIVARLAPGHRRIVFNREFTIRQRDGRAEKRTLESPDELLAVLAEHFSLHFPAGTRFGQPGAPWPV